MSVIAEQLSAILSPQAAELFATHLDFNAKHCNFFVNKKAKFAFTFVENVEALLAVHYALEEAGVATELQGYQRSITLKVTDGTPAEELPCSLTGMKPKAAAKSSKQASTGETSVADIESWAIMNVKQLKAECKKAGLTGYAKLDRAGLFNLLKAPRTVAPAAKQSTPQDDGDFAEYQAFKAWKAQQTAAS
jgi:hypothetical protein